MLIAARQFRLLSWKNFILLRKRVVLTVIQLLLPVFFIIILFLIRQTIAPDKYGEKYHGKIGFAYHVLFYEKSQLFKRWGIAYTPKTLLTSFVVDNLKANLQQNGVSKIELYQDVSNYSIFEDLYLQNDTIYLNTFVFISFDKEVDIWGGKDVQYSLRFPAEQHWKKGDQNDWLTEGWCPKEIKATPRSTNELGDITTPGYYREGFVLLQTIIDDAIIKYQYDQALGIKPLPGPPVALTSFPYPAYVSDEYTLIIKFYMPLFIMVCFVVNATLVAVDVTLEKERKLKESMRLMGLKVWVNWLAWFLNHLVMMLISVLLMTFFFHFKINESAIFRLSDPSITFVFILLFSISVIMFAFLMSSIFAKANSAAAATAIIYLLSYVPYYFIQIYYNTVSFPAKIVLCLFNNIAMSFGCMQISKLETIGLGLHWNNFGDTYLAQDDLTMGLVLLMLLVDILLYGLLTAYFDAIFPGEFGVALPFYFPFTRWYWLGHKTEEFKPDDLVDDSEGSSFEKAEKKKRVGVRIRGLSKSFSKGSKPAVDNISVDMYEGYITAILGHNGAGKTTTMFMLTGFIKPTKGKVYINGHDTSKEMTKVRSSLGLCPQHNILFNQLTVHQHLVFFATLKGCSSRKAQEEAESMASLVGLDAKRETLSKSLSGGMKRKLSIAIALIGGSKFVILDEPTSGMDPESRRQTWELLQQVRGGRSIVLSTHFMDEADYLADRIAIMASGKIKCYGTPMFLKNRYGIGYHLTITKNGQCDPKSLTDLITQNVMNAKFESELGTELIYLLPKEESKRIAKLFKVIETEQEELGIESFGVSVSTMEEVFIKVSEGQDCIEWDETEAIGYKNKVINRQSFPFKLATAEEFNDDCPGMSEYDPHSSVEIEKTRYKEFFSKDFSKQGFFKRKVAQSISLFGKRVLNSLRDWKMFFFQLLLPFIFTLLACIAIHNMQTKGNPPALLIDIPFDNIPHWQPKYITPVLFDYGKVPATVNSVWERCVKQVLNDDVEVVVLRKPGTNLSNSLQFKEHFLYGNFSLDEYLMQMAKQNIFKYKRNYLFALKVTIADNRIEGFFQDEAYHAMPLVMNKVNNIRLCKYLFDRSSSNPVPNPQSPPSSNNISVSTFPTIHTINFPLPWHRNKTLVGIAKLNNITLSAGILSNSVAFGMSLMIGTFIIFIISERHCGSKHSQFMSGADPVTFWATSFLWDAINYLLPLTSVIVVILGFQTEGYVENLRYVVFLLVTYFWAMLGLVYCVSLLPMDPSNGYILITVVNVFTGTVANLMITIMKYPTFKIAYVAYKLEWLFYALFPNFSLSKGLLDISFNYQGLKICGGIEKNYLGSGLKTFCDRLKSDNATFPCCRENCGDLCLFYDENYLALDGSGAGRSVVFMGLQGLIGVIVLFLHEYLRQRVLLALKKNRHYKRKDFAKHAAVENNETSVRTNITVLSEGTASNGNTCTLVPQEEIYDSDVFEEENKTLSLMTKDLESDKNALVLIKVSKFYGRLLAVDNLCLTIKKGECFGLLGVNGAGKTTTFKMLVGEEVMEEGQVHINGEKWGQYTSSIGYCPQFDALVDQMTVRETLFFYASLRGIRFSELREVVDNLVEIFLLSDHADKKAGNLSGGNKRKLGVAISLVGNPPIVFLDEPTTGMDPAARRKLWNVITAVRQTGKTIVLTSHSMEECEALCTRIAIMVNGRFQCLGSTQHLKSKFGGGFTVVIKMKANKKQEVVRYYTKCLASFINKMFPNNILKDHHEGLLHYHISPAPLQHPTFQHDSLEASRHIPQNNLNNLDYPSHNSSIPYIPHNAPLPITWSSLFQALEKAREPFMVEDYSVAQTTLEELFIGFAKKQH